MRRRRSEPWSIVTNPSVEWVEDNWLSLDKSQQQVVWTKYRSVVEQTRHRLCALLTFAGSGPMYWIELVPSKPLEYIKIDFVIDNATTT